MKMDRREFLRKAGLGSITLASFPTLIDALATPARAQAGDLTYFHFWTQSAAGPAGTPASPQHRLFMGGEVRFDAGRPGSQAFGGGAYVHYLFPGANPPTGGTPLPIVSSGVWKPRLLVSYQKFAAWGVGTAGIAELVIDLFGEIPSKAVVRGARLRYICNIGGAGITTGDEEGFFLSVPGTDFFTGATPGPFRPLVPPTGPTSPFVTVPIPS